MADANFEQFLQGTLQTFNPYGVGNKTYGTGRSAPNVGPVSDKSGYRMRDQQARMRRNALLKRMQKGQRGQYMSSDWLRGQR